VFQPHKHPEKAIGELWAVLFNGETQQHVAAKTERRIADCAFDANAFAARVGEALLVPGRARGTAGAAGERIAWDLRFDGEAAPLFLLPPAMYEASLPKAKALVGLPLARFSGALEINGESLAVDSWVGSQNHNWGSKHTDLYAWGQVAGFDNSLGSFLEVATAQIKLGPIWMPAVTPLVLRHGGAEYALTALGQSRRAKGEFSYFTWSFASEDDAVRIAGKIEAPRQQFVGLRYYNPPGGIKHCLNSKLASCELTLLDTHTGVQSTLSTAHRAAFEILTDDTQHGVEMAPAVIDRIGPQMDADQRG
jgi:hypothetical protein